MNKKFLSVIISIVMILSAFATTALAKSPFPDVLSPDHDWAAAQIEEMTELGIIKGYSDGTFKPDKAITKIEAALLFARVAGFSDNNNAKIVELAAQKFKNVLDRVDFGAYSNYKKEIAFLLYKNILTADTVEEYLGGGKINEEFPRSDAAVLLSNIMGAKINANGNQKLDFEDADQIPDNKKGYISYVVEEGLMNGVEKEDGTVVFDADKALSRAQVCVLLYRIVDKLGISSEAGVVDSVNTESGVLAITNNEGAEKSYVIADDVKILVYGENAEIEDIYTKSDVVIVRFGKTIVSVDVINPESNLTVSGTVTSVVSSTGYAKISILESASEETKTYYADGEDFKVTTNGVLDEFDSIKLNDYVVISLLGSEIVSIDRQTAQATVQGIVEKINLSSPIALTVRTKDELTNKETVSKYTVSDSATIRRNGKSATLREVLAGDEVVLTITRGEISKIVATSVKGDASGSIVALKIAAQSEITISTNTGEKTYAVSMDALFTVAGKEATIYDLRLGNVVNLTLSGSTATKVEQIASSAVTTKTGIIESVSTSYGYIGIIGTGETANEQIFAAKAGSTISAKIINGETGKEIAFKNLKKGDSIIATGAYTNGAFVAKTIVVTPAAE